ncbi:MAG: DUF3237 family protein [Solobacterium sp.]|nr:DUF3237 family protein [Solobacterium sp.]
MKDEPVLEIRIDIDRPGLRMETERGEVSMIPFSGAADSDLFHGIVEPWGVDTQILNHAGVRHMSARYVLTGKDKDGQECHIYIENNGYLPNVPSKVFKTVPTFYTDSKLLAPYLHYDHFYGIGSVEDGQLWIRFYEV